MTFINRLSWIFFSPSRLFEDIKQGNAPWWQAWIWLSIIYVVVGYASIPINIALLEINPSNLSPEQVDQQMAFMEGAGKWVQIVSTPVILLLVTLAVSGLVYVMVSLLSDKANFKKFFALSLYTSIISSMANVVGTVVVRLKGVDTIRTVEDARFSIGLKFLAPEEGALVKTIVGSFDFFAVWSFVLVVMGLMHVFEMSRRQAIYCIIPMWIMYVGMLLLGEYTGGLS
ncbi:MAG: YIP1 family protein [Candidatus Latescibacterota bacterium]|jgi:hypothetical protein